MKSFPHLKEEIKEAKRKEINEAKEENEITCFCF